VQAACAFRLFSQEVDSRSRRARANGFAICVSTRLHEHERGSRTNPGGYASAPESSRTIRDRRRTQPRRRVAAFLRSRGYEAVWKDWDATYDGHEIPIHLER